MTNPLKQLSSLLAILAMSTIASADQAPNQHQGFYLSGDLGGILSDQFYNSDSDAPQGFNYNGFGLGGAAGYMFNPYIGVEASIFGSVANSVSSPQDLTLYWYGGSLKLNLPLGERFAFFVKGGVGALNEAYQVTLANIVIDSVSSSTVGGIIGGGFGFSINKTSELSIEANGIIVSNNDNAGDRSVGYLTLLGLAYTYHF